MPTDMHKWTEADRQRWQDYYDPPDWHSTRATANHFDVPYHVVYEALDTRSPEEANRLRYGYSGDKRKRARLLYEHGALRSINDVADHFGVPYYTAWRWLEGLRRSRSEGQKLLHHKRKWRQAKEAVHLTVERDLTHTEAARRLGCSRRTVGKLVQYYRNPPDLPVAP